MSSPARLQRVVYIVSLFPCWSETFIVREINALIANGVDVRIISLKEPSETLVQDDAAVLVDRVRYPGSALRAIGSAVRALASEPRATAGSLCAIVADTWRAPRVLVKSLGAWLRGLEHVAWLRELDPQFIHSHWATYPSTVAWSLGRILRRPFGFTSHAHDIFTNRQLIARKIEDAALAVTISRFNVGWLETHATPIAREKLKVVHCGVDTALNPWSPEGRDPGSILAVGRLDPIKGFATLIEALSVLSERNLDYRCRIVGSGPLEAQLRALARTRGVEGNVEFMGAQPQVKVRQWMNEATLFVLPSEVAADGGRDGIPVALMEAMATGCPVVSTRVSGIPELIENEREGLIVEQRQPQALADAMERLLKDREFGFRLTRNARTKVEREFDADSEGRRLIAHMETALDVR